MSILDIKAQDTTGRWYNIEMQINEDLNFAKRAIYYWAKLVTDQLSEGVMFRELKKTVSINIFDFDFVPDDEFHSLYKIINTRTGIVEILVLPIKETECSKYDSEQLMKLQEQSGFIKTALANSQEDVWNEL